MAQAGQQPSTVFDPLLDVLGRQQRFLQFIKSLEADTLASSPASSGLHGKPGELASTSGYRARKKKSASNFYTAEDKASGMVSEPSTGFKLRNLATPSTQSRRKYPSTMSNEVSKVYASRSLLDRRTKISVLDTEAARLDDSVDDWTPDSFAGKKGKRKSRDMSSDMSFGDDAQGLFGIKAVGARENLEEARGYDRPSYISAPNNLPLGKRRKFSTQ